MRPAITGREFAAGYGNLVRRVAWPIAQAGASYLGKRAYNYISAPSTPVASMAKRSRFPSRGAKYVPRRRKAFRGRRRSFRGVRRRRSSKLCHMPSFGQPPKIMMKLRIYTEGGTTSVSSAALFYFTPVLRPTDLFLPITGSGDNPRNWTQYTALWHDFKVYRTDIRSTYSIRQPIAVSDTIRNDLMCGFVISPLGSEPTLTNLDDVTEFPIRHRIAYRLLRGVGLDKTCVVRKTVYPHRVMGWSKARWNDDPTTQGNYATSPSTVLSMKQFAVARGVAPDTQVSVQWSTTMVFYCLLFNPVYQAHS